MKDVTIKIKGTRYEEGEQEEQMEFVSEAKMYEKSGARYFLFDESIFSGFSDSKTTLKVMDNAIKVKRTGGEEDAFGMELEFSKGTRFLNKYYTPYGNFDVEVLTTDINTDLSPQERNRNRNTAVEKELKEKVNKERTPCIKKDLMRTSTSKSKHSTF